MSLTDEEAAELERLTAKATETDDADTVVEAVADTAEAVADAVGEAVAEAVTEVEHQEELELPDPIEQATADAIRIGAEADADVIRIEAQADADAQRIAAEADAASQVIETVGDEMETAEEAEPPMPEPDQAPKTSHPFFRPLWGSRK